MKIALVNPRWTFEGSIYFGCRAPHLPLEFGYTRALLEKQGTTVKVIDAQLFDFISRPCAPWSTSKKPEMIVVTTAPSYLFWRCAPPELRIPVERSMPSGTARHGWSRWGHTLR